MLCLLDVALTRSAGTALEVSRLLGVEFTGCLGVPRGRFGCFFSSYWCPRSWHSRSLHCRILPVLITSFELSVLTYFGKRV